MEEWKDIKGYEGLYQVSNLGRVRSLDRIVLRGSIKQKVKGTMMTPHKDGSGYMQITLRKNGNVRNFKVHRLVYVAFVGEIPEGCEINHKNENKESNTIDNLEAISHKDNMRYGTRTERQSTSKSKAVYGYDKEGNLVVSFSSTKESAKFGFDQGHVAACARGDKLYKTHKGLIWTYEKR